MSITLDSTHDQICEVIHKYILDHLEDKDITIHGVRTALMNNGLKYYENATISLKVDDVLQVYIGSTMGRMVGKVFRYTFTGKEVTWAEGCWSDIAHDGSYDMWCNPLTIDHTNTL